MTNEHELKFLNIGKNDMRRLLTDNGYTLSLGETLMRRHTFHFPKDHPEHESKWGRVRDEGNKITATIKWYENPKSPSINDVHEKEVTVDTWADGEEWVLEQGFIPTAYQENLRETWVKPDVPGLEITIDTWPGLKPYIEIEANSETCVHNASIELGFSPQTGIAGGTEIIYEKELGIPARIIKSLKRITFDEPPLLA